MCIIIAKPADKKLPETIYQECFFNNNDGAGLSYVEDGKLVVKKGFMKYADLMAEIVPKEHLQMVIHFRVASPRMVINAANCHPFMVNSQVDEVTKIPRYQFAISHNGKLNHRNTDKHSDTSCFVHDVMRPMLERDPWFFDQPWSIEMFGKYIGSDNKMAIMRYDTKEDKIFTYIVNQDGGYGDKKANWDGDVWYSNLSWKYKPIKMTSVYSAAAGAGHSNWDGYGDEYEGEVGQLFAANKAFMEAKKLAYEGTKKKELEDNTSYIPKGFEEFAAWAVPDANGWRWSFMNHKWFNVKTVIYIDELTTRETPYVVERNGAVVSYRLRKPLALSAGDKAELDKDKNTMELEGGIKIATEDDDVDKLHHLTAEEKHIVIHEAVGHLKRMGWAKKEIAALAAAHKIAQLREVCKWCWGASHLENMHDVLVDDWIVKRIKDGKFRMDLIAGEKQLLAEDNAINNAKE